MFRMGAVQSDQSPQSQALQPESQPRSRSAAPASIRLAPISLGDLKAVAERKRHWEEEDAVEYELEKKTAASVAIAPRQLPQPRGRLFWGRGGIAEVLLIALRKISDYAYVISVPILLLMLLAIIFKERELAVMAGVLVILLNLARLGIDGFVLVTLAFKNGPIQGVLFFIPPLTFYYLSQRGKVMKEAFGRFLAAALPIIGVLLLAIFVPWLRGGDDTESNVLNRDRLRNDLRDVRENIKTRIDTKQDSKK
jgi:hypothetical protein